MVARETSHFSCGQLLRGRKCVFWRSVHGAAHRARLRDVSPGILWPDEDLTRLKREIDSRGFYQLVPAYRLAQDLGVDVKVVSRVYQRLRGGAVSSATELEAGRLKGEIELDEGLLVGRRKGKRGRGAAGKVLFSAFWRDGRVYTLVVQSVTAEALMCHIQGAHPRGLGVLHRCLRGCQSLKDRQASYGQPFQVIRGPAHQKPHQRHRGLLELCQAYPV